MTERMSLAPKDLMEAGMTADLLRHYRLRSMVEATASLLYTLGLGYSWNGRQRSARPNTFWHGASVRRMSGSLTR